MIREVTAMDARKGFGELLNEVKYRHDSILIKKAGKPVAALIDIELFEKINLLKANFNQLSAEIAQAYQDVPVNEVEAEIQEAIENIREN